MVRVGKGAWTASPDGADEALAACSALSALAKSEWIAANVRAWRYFEDDGAAFGHDRLEETPANEKRVREQTRRRRA